MKRCAKKVTQNLNESVHAKLWRRVLKFKHHSKKRYRFACLMTVLVHNFGHEKGPSSATWHPRQSQLRKILGIRMQKILG